MKKQMWLIVAFVVVGGGFAAYFYLQKEGPAQGDMPPPVAMSRVSPLPAPVLPAIQHPLESPIEGAPLPDLDQSDAPLLEALGSWPGEKFLRLFVTDGLIRRVVATVDNLPRRDLPVVVIPLKRVPKAFVTEGKDESLMISARNSARYALYIKLVEATEAENLIAVYSRFYPLFQRAYEDLGYPQAYFNDRLVKTIDDLLAAPEIEGAIMLVQPKVLYEYADSDLEMRSAGQKIMIRMGRENAAKVKAKLREIRILVTKAQSSQ